MRRVGVLAAVVVACAPSAQGQEITESEFLSGLRVDGAAERSLGEGLARAEAARARAGLLANPRADFWREAPDSNPRVTNWTIAWTPPLDGRFGIGKKAADLGVAAAQERLALDKARLRRELRAAFAEWSLGFERRQRLTEHLDLVARLAGVERDRARVGEGSGLSARRLELARAEVRSSVAVVSAAYVRAEALVRAWRPDLRAAAVPGMLQLPEPPAESDSPGSPELRALALDSQQAEAEKKRAGRFLSFPTLQFGWQQLHDRGISRSGPILAASWTIPLFDRDQPARLEAGRKQEVAAARLELAKARVNGELAGAAAAYRTLWGASGEARAAAENADRVIEAATAAFRAGEATLTDLLESLRAASAARIDELELRRQALAAHRDWEAALGRARSGGAF